MTFTSPQQFTDKNLLSSLPGEYFFILKPSARMKTLEKTKIFPSIVFVG